MDDNELVKNNCLYQIFAAQTNHDFLDLIDFRKIIKDKCNFLNIIILFKSNFPYSLHACAKFDHTVLVPIIKKIFANRQMSCLNHNFGIPLDPKYKTLNSLLLYNYFDSFYKCLKLSPKFDSIIVLDIVQVWLCRKLIRLPSHEKKIEEIILYILKNKGRIKDKHCNSFIANLIYIGKQEKEILAKFTPPSTKDDYNEELNAFIESKYLPKNPQFQDYYKHVYEEDYNIVSRCKKYVSLFQKISTQPLMIVQ
jgi:hypothetical protein